MKVSFGFNNLIKSRMLLFCFFIIPVKTMGFWRFLILRFWFLRKKVRYFWKYLWVKLLYVLV